MITLTIDDKKIESEEGQKILEVALRNNIEIPHLCYHPELKPFGGCRLCLVEVKGEKELVSSCVAAAKEGMEIHTATPRIQRARKSILQLLLLNHPLDCLICDRGGNCVLQKLAFELQVEPNKYKMKKRVTKGKLRRANLEIDPKKCMHCGLCVRACKELRHYGAIDFYHRGFKTEIGIPFSDESHCELCGQCIEICPVAGVIGLDSKYVARPWEIEKVESVCPYCGTGCLITLSTKDNKLVKVGSEDTSGANKGKICVKGRFGCKFINSSEKITSPLIKKGSQFQKATWDEAIDYISGKLRKIIESDGAQAIGGIGSVKCTNEDNYVFQKFLRAVIGTNNIDNFSRMDHAPTLGGLSKTLGVATMNNSLDKIGAAELIFLIGTHPSDTLPVVSLNIKSAIIDGKSKLIIADPRKIKLVSIADQWLGLKPESDLALLGGIMHILIKESLIDETALACIKGFEAFKESLEAYGPEQAARLTGIPKENLFKTARAIAAAKSLAIVYSSGVTQHVNGTDNVAALANLLLLTGHASQENSGIYPLRSDNNSQGACDMGTLPDYLPGYQPIEDAGAREKFTQAWGKEIPAKPGLTTPQMLEAVKNGKLKALYLMGDNLVRYVSNKQTLQEALNTVELLIVQDVFLTQTAKLADVVLPATSFAERSGTFTNMERRVQKINKALNPSNGTLNDWEIICKLSAKMGYPMNYSSASDILKEINTTVPIYGGITPQRLRKGGIYWPCPDDTHPGAKFVQSSENASFAPLPSTAVEEDDSSYPFKLIIGGSLFHSGSGSLSMKSKILRDITPDETLTVSSEDAAKLGITDGDKVKISSREGSIDAEISISPVNPEGIVFLPRHFEDLSVQELISGRLDPVSYIPATKVCSVNLTKI